jgi:hypothetical protein
MRASTSRSSGASTCASKGPAMRPAQSPAPGQWGLSAPLAHWKVTSAATTKASLPPLNQWPGLARRLAVATALRAVVLFLAVGFFLAAGMGRRTRAKRGSMRQRARRVSPAASLLRRLVSRRRAGAEGGTQPSEHSARRSAPPIPGA